MRPERDLKPPPGRPGRLIPQPSPLATSKSRVDQEQPGNGVNSLVRNGTKRQGGSPALAPYGDRMRLQQSPEVLNLDLAVAEDLVQQAGPDRLARMGPYHGDCL